jgi:hypothetical protein
LDFRSRGFCDHLNKKAQSQADISARIPLHQKIALAFAVVGLCSLGASQYDLAAPFDDLAALDWGGRSRCCRKHFVEKSLSAATVIA